jgi:hypothetical protein
MVRYSAAGFNRLLKNAHLRRFPCLPAGRLILPRVKHEAGLLRRTSKYASGRLTDSSAWQESLLIRRDATLRISGALHLGIFEQPTKNDFFSNLFMTRWNF